MVYGVNNDDMKHMLVQRDLASNIDKVWVDPPSVRTAPWRVMEYMLSICQQ